MTEKKGVEILPFLSNHNLRRSTWSTQCWSPRYQPKWDHCDICGIGQWMGSLGPRSWKYTRKKKCISPSHLYLLTNPISPWSDLDGKISANLGCYADLDDYLAILPRNYGIIKQTWLIFSGYIHETSFGSQISIYGFDEPDPNEVEQHSLA